MVIVGFSIMGLSENRAPAQHPKPRNPFNSPHWNARNVTFNDIYIHLESFTSTFQAHAFPNLTQHIFPTASAIITWYNLDSSVFERPQKISSRRPLQWSRSTPAFRSRNEIRWLSLAVVVWRWLIFSWFHGYLRILMAIMYTYRSIRLY